MNSSDVKYQGCVRVGVIVNGRDRSDTIALEKAIKKFKKKVKDSNLIIELHNKSFFKKKSQIKRETKNKSQIRNKYKILRDKEIYG